MAREDSFFGGTLRAVFPLLVWAAHFAFLYVFIPVACRREMHRMQVAGQPLIETVLVAASIVAIALLGASIWRAWRASDTHDDRPLPASRFWGAVLALIAVTWVTVAIFVFEPCAFTRSAPAAACSCGMARA